MPLVTVQNITMDNLTHVLNASNIPEFAINVNMAIYGGWLVFILLFLAWFVLFTVGQQKRDQPINNLAESGAIVSVLSILLRVVYIIKDGIWSGLLTEYQMWIFPVLTAIFAMVAWMMREE